MHVGNRGRLCRQIRANEPLLFRRCRVSLTPGLPTDADCGFSLSLAFPLRLRGTLMAQGTAKGSLRREVD